MSNMDFGLLLTLAGAGITLFALAIIVLVIKILVKFAPPAKPPKPDA